MNYNVVDKSVTNYSVTTNGSFDGYTLSFSGVTSESGETFITYLTAQGMSSSAITGTLPIIPIEITNQYPSLSTDNLEMNKISFTDFAEINSEEYFNSYIRNTNDNRVGVNYDVVEYDIIQPNGRIAFSKEMQQKEIEEFLKESRGY